MDIFFVQRIDIFVLGYFASDYSGSFVSYRFDSCTYYIKYLTFFLFQYGKDYEYDAPVKLLDKHLHAMSQSPDEQLVVVSQVSFSFHVIVLTNEMLSSCLAFLIKLTIFLLIAPSTVQI